MSAGFIQRYLPVINFVIGASALTFQMTVLYPWHQQLDTDFEQLKLKQETMMKQLHSDVVKLHEEDLKLLETSKKDSRNKFIMQNSGFSMLESPTHAQYTAVKSSGHGHRSRALVRESADDSLVSARHPAIQSESTEYNRFLPQELQDELFSRPNGQHHSRGLLVDSMGSSATFGWNPPKPAHSGDSVWSYSGHKPKSMQAASLYEPLESNWPRNDVRQPSLLLGNQKVSSNLPLQSSSFRPPKLNLPVSNVYPSSSTGITTPTKLFDGQSAYGGLVSPQEPSLLLSGGSSASIMYNHLGSSSDGVGINAPRLKPLSSARSSLASLNSSDRDLSSLYHDILTFEDLDIQDEGPAMNINLRLNAGSGTLNDFAAPDIVKKRRANSVQSDYALKPSDLIIGSDASGKKKPAGPPKRRRCKTSSTVTIEQAASATGSAQLPSTARRHHRRNKSEGTNSNLDLLRPIDDEETSDAPAATREQQEEKKVTLFKTELCRSFEETGACKFGDKCLFAHGHNEMRQVSKHPKYKTEVCKSFWMEGHCKYGKRCCFLHVQNTGDGQPFPPTRINHNGQSRNDNNSNSIIVDTNNHKKPPITAAKKKSLIESFGLALDDSDTEQQR